MTFRLAVNPSTSSAGRWDEDLIHENEDIVTDLPEFNIHLQDNTVGPQTLALTFWRSSDSDSLRAVSNCEVAVV